MFVINSISEAKSNAEDFKSDLWVYLEEAEYKGKLSQEAIKQVQEIKDRYNAFLDALDDIIVVD